MNHVNLLYKTNSNFKKPLQPSTQKPQEVVKNEMESLETVIVPIDTSMQLNISAEEGLLKEDFIYNNDPNLDVF